MKVEPLSIAGAYESPRVSSPTSAGSSWSPSAATCSPSTLGHRPDLVQTNVSVSSRGTVRGIHFADVPPGQAKYVTVLSGSLVDYVVDIRVGSPTFGQWEAVSLDTSTAGRSTSPRGWATPSAPSRTDDGDVPVHRLLQPDR